MPSVPKIRRPDIAPFLLAGIEAGCLPSEIADSTGVALNTVIECINAGRQDGAPEYLRDLASAMDDREARQRAALNALAVARRVVDENSPQHPAFTA